MVPKVVNNIRKRIGKTIYSHSLIEENDRILIGLSGGKDSYVLLDSLADRRKYLPFNFEIIAAHIHIENIGYQTDKKYLQHICDERKIPLHYFDFEIEKPEDLKKSMCFLCSWYRRKTLFKASKTLECNKLALGHHMDDAVETLLLNQIFHGSLSGLPHKLKMFEGRVHVIRPLLEMRNKEMLTYANEMSFQQQLKDCPYTNTNRQTIRNLLQTIENINPAGVKNIFRSPNKIFTEYLPINR